MTTTSVDIPIGHSPRDNEDMFKYFQNYVLSEEDRKWIWKVKIGNKLRLNRRVYKELEGRLEVHGIPKEQMKVIVNDLDRTFPECDSRSQGVKMYQDLVKMLSLFSLYRPDFGYVQGMSYLAICLYFTFDPYESFVLFSNLILCNKLMHDLYNMNLQRVVLY